VNYFAIPALLAGIYQLLALAAALRRLRERPPASSYCPPVSILKPVRGAEPGFAEAIRSQAGQDYPDFEMLFGSGDPRDPALAEVRRVAAEYPAGRIRVIDCGGHMDAWPNAKVGVLDRLAREARHGVLVVSDSDITVGAGYLRQVAAPLEDPAIGMVTCLYRAGVAAGAGVAARLEALGVSTDFTPGILVARVLGIAEFALGSTMVFRAQELQAIGGFAAIGDYLADDYQLGRRICDLGRTVTLASAVVETRMAGQSWGEVWRHQLRWSRTIRVSRSGYYGYAITNATVWSLLAMAGGAWPAAVFAMAVRMATALITGLAVLGDRQLLRYWFLIPVRDLWGFAVWVAALAGDTVEWRGRKLRLRKDGRISAA
jgi:ceramide glucosyltransferase